MCKSLHKDNDTNTRYKGLFYHGVNWTFIYFQTGVRGLLSCPDRVCAVYLYVILCHCAAHIVSPSVIPHLFLCFHLSIEAEMFPMLTTATEKCNSRRSVSLSLFAFFLLSHLLSSALFLTHQNFQSWSSKEGFVYSCNGTLAKVD